VLLSLKHSFARYIVSGSLATLLHLGVLALLIELWSIHATLATTIGFVVGSILNYLLQYYWAFDNGGPHAKRFSRYCTVSVITMAINSGIFWSLNEGAGIPYLLSQIIVTGIIVLLNYEANRRFTFA